MRGDATTALLRAIRTALKPSGPISVEQIRSRDWASATFTGAVHEVAFRLDGGDAAAAADRFLDGLEEREFALGAHILADIKLVAREDSTGADGKPQVRISIEALTIEAD